MMLTALALATTLSFDDALARALKARGIDTAFTRTIDAPSRTQPVIRVETTAQTAENVDLVSQGVVRFDALSAIVSVDYPLFDHGAASRRVARAQASAQMYRRRALDEADEVFRETLDAYAQLYLAQQRMELFRDAVARADALRERAQTQLASGRITNLVAANWEEQALATESRVVDLDLQRLDAETRLRQLMGDTNDAHYDLALDLRPLPRPPMLDRNELEVTRRRLDLAEVEAAQRPQWLLSAFGGAASISSPFGRTYGLYGLRLNFTLPARDAARVAEAQLAIEDAERARDDAASASRRRLASLTVAFDAGEKRIAILTKAVDLARARQQSVARLVSNGVRTEADLADAANDIAARESDLLGVRVEQWKLARMLERP